MQKQAGTPISNLHHAFDYEQIIPWICFQHCSGTHDISTMSDLTTHDIDSSMTCVFP